jgi:hypothetical protein
MLVQTDAFAQRYRDFHGRDFRRFSYEERRLWGAGRWFHEFHDGRLGWWWVVGGVWYYYPEPIYPFPTYVPIPDVAVNAPPPYPPAYAAPYPPAYAPPYQPPYPQAAAPLPPSGPPQAAASWDYCDNPEGYYPYVQNCTVQWRPVPATPPGYAPGGPPPPPGR